MATPAQAEASIEAAVLAAATPATLAVPAAPAPAGDELTDANSVIAIVPKAFRLTLSATVVKTFEAGVQRMLTAYADHWFARANGVKRFEG